MVVAIVEVMAKATGMMMKTKKRGSLSLLPWRSQTLDPSIWLISRPRASPA